MTEILEAYCTLRNEMKPNEMERNEMGNLCFAKWEICTLRNGKSVLCEMGKAVLCEMRNLYFAKWENLYFAK